MAKSAALANVLYLVWVNSNPKTLDEMIHAVKVTDNLFIMSAIYCDTVNGHMEKVVGSYPLPIITDIATQ